jgi:hypothetical protein
MKTIKIISALAAVVAVALLTAAAPYWYQIPQCPHAYANRDGTRIRVYVGTPADYAEATVVYKGTATPEKVASVLKQAIKGKK